MMFARMSCTALTLQGIGSCAQSELYVRCHLFVCGFGVVMMMVAVVVASIDPLNLFIQAR